MRKSTAVCILLAILFLSVSPEIAGSQNWRNICSTGKTFYFRANNPMEGFRTDTFSVPSAGDTLWYSYIRFRGVYGQCLDSTHGSVLGRKVFGKANGMFYFFNSADDSLRLKTNAALNASWTFYNHSGQPTITAQVTGIILDSVMGTLDSVKVITLSGFVAGITATIKLSKHYGIALTPDLYNFTQTDSTWKLSGKTQGGIGFQTVTSWRQIFRYDTGDVFHIRRHKDLPNMMYKDTLMNVRILQVEWAADSSWVKYTYSRCMHIVHMMPPPSNLDVVISDTLVQTCSYTSAWESSRLSFMSFEKDGWRGHKIWYRQYNERQAVYYGYLDYMWSGGCWRIYGGQMPIPAGETFAPGLGLTDYWVSAHSEGETRKLIYYKKGNETWGVPNTVFCWPVSSGEQKKELQLEVYPNPSDGQFGIRVGGTDYPGEYLCTVTDLQGRTVFLKRFTGSSLFVSIPFLRAGMYILTLKDESGGMAMNHKLMIK